MHNEILRMIQNSIYFSTQIKTRMNKYIRSVLAAGVEGSFIHQNVIKAVIINVFSYLALTALGYYTYFGFTHLDEKGLPYSLAMGSFFSLTLVNLLIFRFKKKFVLASNFVVILMTLLAFALIIRLGSGITGLFWLYVYPSFAIFILGRVSGTIYTTFVFIGTVVLLKISPEFMIHYPTEIHSRFIFSYIIAASFPIIFEIVRHNTYKAFKIADAAKSEYLAQSLQQNEEIQTQKEQLEAYAAKLETLNIAASKTDNSILLCDTHGKVEWVNNGFTRLTGFTLQFYNEKYATIFESSSHPKFAEIFNSCIQNKESAIYENNIFTRTGDQVWVQTTITPILNDAGDVIRLISIDSDITKIKLAEQEILQKTEEISAQNNALEQQHLAISQINTELTAQRDFIQFQNEQINSSLSYAKTIQQAILPTSEVLDSLYENFTIYRPKDIVSGDFYWFRELNFENEIIRFIAVADCTGHGVPGAFMSMIAARLLNEIIVERGTHDTAQILEQLDFAVKDALNQEHTDNKDGLDIAILKHVIDKNKANFFYFSGSKRPLFIYKTQENTVQRIKGNRSSIGGFASKNTDLFVSHQILLNPHDVLYLTTDGYIDQNNPERKKIGTDTFIEVLQSLGSDDLRAQKQKLEHFLNMHQGNASQRDDITILAVKFKNNV